MNGFLAEEDGIDSSQDVIQDWRKVKAIMECEAGPKLDDILSDETRRIFDLVAENDRLETSQRQGVHWRASDDRLRSASVVAGIGYATSTDEGLLPSL